MYPSESRDRGSRRRGGSGRPYRGQHPASAQPSPRPPFVGRPPGRFHRPSSASARDNPSTLPLIGYKMLVDMMGKEPDAMIIDMDRDYFQLDAYLSDDRVKTNVEWLEMLTTLFVRMLDCLGQEQRIGKILMKLPSSTYWNALYEEIRKTDPKIGALRFGLILKTLKILDRLLTISPHAESDVSPFTERINSLLAKNKVDSEEVTAVQQLCASVCQKAEYIYQKEQEAPAVKHSYVETRPPPDDFRLLNVIPAMVDLLSHERVYLRQNLVEQGAFYESGDHYLDVHFRLLREDFLVPLRDGVQTYLGNPGARNSDVRVYENVYSLGPKINPRSGMVYGLRLDKKKFGRIQWANSRRLIYGSLLALTADHFQSCTIVTVEDRSQIETDLTFYVRPYIESMANQNTTKWDLLLSSQSLTMVETTSYFEAYRHILRALQRTSSQDFPLAPYILKLSHDVVPPDYVTRTTRFDFTPLLVPMKVAVTCTSQVIQGARSSALPSNEIIFRINYDDRSSITNRDRQVSLLNQNEWPSSDRLQLNEKQHEALILALTKKVALIQGPPGTGKTFLGVKIAELLLHNRSAWCPSGTDNTPILMVCQTNHALDQFLEHIIDRLNMKSGLVRVGGRSKNERILSFSLQKRRQYYRENRLIPGKIFEQKRAIMTQKLTHEFNIQAYGKTIESSHAFLTGLRVLQERQIISAEHYRSLTMGNGAYRSLDIVLSGWLDLDGKTVIVDSINDVFDQVTLDDNPVVNQDIDESNEEQEEEERRRDDTEQDDEFFLPTQISPKIIPTPNDEPDNVDDGWYTANNKKRRKQLLYKLLNSPSTMTSAAVARLDSNLWTLSMDKRHDLYRYWLQKYREWYNASVSNAHIEFSQAIAAHAQYMQLEDYYILKDAIIVAMTTTCAAKYFDVLQRLACKIVIVEEAAEIFEAHIITSLSPKCEHLILIGDHVQLRPIPSVYKLAKNYNMDVSLFERFVKNDFPSVRLNIQHRMRPEICQLMTHFYSDLQNHKTVLTDRPAMMGVKQNLYFVNHNHPETMIAEGNSKQNVFEAEYVIALAHFLLKQGYDKSKLTILVMYLGQRALISRLMKTSPHQKMLQGLRVNVTDSYQGEENDIILLSLVRSNNVNNSIGFLKIHNRICVALSRTRCAMFIVGNLNFLMEHEEMWKKISGTLFQLNAVGTGLPLCCTQHPDNDPFIADTAAAFAQRPEGGCEKMCGTRLPCGHSCPNFCHNYGHEKVRCTKPCNQTLPSCSHRCRRKCHSSTPDDHGPCQEPVLKIVQGCQHEIRLACGVEPTSDQCTFKVPVQLGCNHTAQVTCAVRNSGSLDQVHCSEPCGATLLCDHACRGTCHNCKTGQLHVPCKEPCARQLLCTHLCQTSCANNDSSCVSECQTSCIHSSCSAQCGETCVPCQEPCTNQCKHEKCSRACSEVCDRSPCSLPCMKLLPDCNHPCIGLCGDPCPPYCRLCNKQLVQEIFYGDEDKPYARFVLLPDCNHLFESSRLDGYVTRFFAEQVNGHQPICYPECPRCNVAIRHCARYKPVTNRIQSWIEQIKLKQQNGITKDQLIEQRRQLSAGLSSLYGERCMIEAQYKAFNQCLARKELPVNIDAFHCMKNTTEFLKEIERLSNGAKLHLRDQHVTEMMETSARHLIAYMLCQFVSGGTRNYTQQQLMDVENELRRIRCLINYYLLTNLAQLEIVVSKMDDLPWIKILTHKSGPFTNGDYQQYEKAVERYRPELRSLRNYLVNEEPLSVAHTARMDMGSWFACEVNHVYIRDQTSDTANERTCPLCESMLVSQAT